MTDKTTPIAKKAKARKATLRGMLRLALDGKEVALIEFTTSREADGDWLRLVMEQYLRRFRERTE